MDLLCFLIGKFFIRKFPREPQIRKKVLRKSPASNAWAAIFKNAAILKNADFS